MTEVLRQLFAHCFVGIPFSTVLQWRDGDNFSCIQTSQGCIDHVVRSHDDFVRQVVMGEAGCAPEISRGCTWQHCLHPDAFVCKLLVQGLAEGGDVGLAATVDTVEQLWRKACNGRDVDDSASYRYLLT